MKSTNYFIRLFIVLISIASQPIHAMEPNVTTLQQDLQNLQQSLNGLNAQLNQLIVEPIHGPRQQTMYPSTVKSRFPTGRFNKEQALNLFVQDMRKFKTENAKIPPKTNNIFRIMTYNVHFWKDPYTKKDNFNVIWQVIDKINPDVLILEEASSRGRFDQSRMYQELKKRNYNHLAACNTVRGKWFGNIIASRIKPTKVLRAPFDIQERRGQEDRCFVFSELRLPNGKKLHIYGTHLEVGKIKGKDHNEIRYQQMKQISDYVQCNLARENVLIAGDFNASRNEKPVKHLSEIGFKDCFAVLGWQHPQFTSWAGTEIDFIFLNPAWQLPLAGCYIYYDAASDHLPVIMDIKLN